MLHFVICAHSACKTGTLSCGNARWTSGPQTMRAGIALAILIGTPCAAWADSAPVIVIPGRPGVPIIINGVDASYAVVEGDWGFGKGVRVQPTVYGGRSADPVPNAGIYLPRP